MPGKEMLPGPSLAETIWSWAAGAPGAANPPPTTSDNFSITNYPEKSTVLKYYCTPRQYILSSKHGIGDATMTAKFHDDVDRWEAKRRAQKEERELWEHDRAAQDAGAVLDDAPEKRRMVFVDRFGVTVICNGYRRRYYPISDAVRRLRALGAEVIDLEDEGTGNDDVDIKETRYG